MDFWTSEKYGNNKFAILILALWDRVSKLETIRKWEN